MQLNTVSHNSSFGAMRISSRGAAPPGGGLSIKPQSFRPDSEAASPNSIYSKFENEMARRLAESAKKKGGDEKSAPDPTALVKSLSGAMGEVEKLFGRQGATEMMAGILTGTADGLTEQSLISSIQNSLTNLRRLDTNGTKIQELTGAFNKDLSLTLDKELADTKAKSQQTLSLSYALAQHFGLEEARETDEESKEKNGESFIANGFDETGAWGGVAVAKMDEAAAEEIRAAAEEGLAKATSLTVGDIIHQKDGDKVLNKLASFLKDELQDKESAAFVDDCILKARNGPPGASPEMAKMLGQLYSKVAAEGDGDKLAVFENYINNDFKNALNPVLADMAALALPDEPWAEELGVIEFKGLGGISLAGESDAFTLNWGYTKDNTYDKSVSKRVMREDIRGVKAVQEGIEAMKKDKMAKNWDDTAEEKRLKEAKNGAPQNSEIQSTLAEKFAQERRQDKLEEALGMKFGQLSDESRADLEAYIKENFDEEEAQKLLENTKWNSDLMSGLAAIHQGISEADESGDKRKSFMNFLNGALKEEVNKVAEALGGLTFNGWQSADGSDLTAAFKFNGQEVINIKIMAAPPMPSDASKASNNISSGWLIDLMA